MTASNGNGTAKRIVVALLIVLIPSIVGAVIANTVRITAGEVRMENVCEQLREIKDQNREILRELSSIKEKVNAK